MTQISNLNEPLKSHFERVWAILADIGIAFNREKPVIETDDDLGESYSWRVRKGDLWLKLVVSTHMGVSVEVGDENFDDRFNRSNDDRSEDINYPFISVSVFVDSPNGRFCSQVACDLHTPASFSHFRAEFKPSAKAEMTSMVSFEKSFQWIERAALSFMAQSSE